MFKFVVPTPDVPQEILNKICHNCFTANEDAVMLDPRMYVYLICLHLCM